MKKLYITLISIMAAVSMTMTSFAFVGDTEYPYMHGEVKSQSDKTVTVIVELEGDGVLSTQAACDYGDGYMLSTMGKAHQNRLLDAQFKVFGEISSITEAELTYRYTALFNGFAANVPQSQVDAIREIQNVKNVYIAYPIKLHLGASVEQSSSLPADTIDSFDSTGYTGEGQVVAVIDNCFDASHPFFNTIAPTNPKHTSDTINALLPQTYAAGKDISIIYKNSKIPFAYNYAGGNTTVHSTLNNHGTHVAGIVAGANANFSGIAPDAQLVLMRVMDNSGTLQPGAIFQALDDAAALDVDVINMSLGAHFASPSTQPVWNTYLTNAKSRGITVCVSAGNEGMGYSIETADGIMHDRLPSPLNPDYSTSGTPAGYSSVMTVASVNNAKSFDGQNKADYISPTPGAISSFSSWGVNETLELKPEISAPGAFIYSSVLDDEYAQKSGTSMASPHMAGISALMYEWLDDNNITLSDAERIAMVENRLMSTASIIRQSDDVPYSPRVQGAGLVNTAAAMDTPAILIDNTSGSDKSKISLGQINSNSFDISFNVQNLSDLDLTYDNLRLEIMADATTEDGRISGVSKTLSASSTMPASVSISKNSTKTVTFTITLDQSEVLSQKQVFKNGFFIDGFVSLAVSSESSDIPEISIPFTGFYGDWTAAPALDRTIYDEDGSELFVDSAPSVLTGTYLTSNWGTSEIVLGASDTGIEKERIAISPNGDGQGDSLSLTATNLRTTKNNVIKLRNINDATNQYRISFANAVPKFTELPLGFDTLNLSEFDNVAGDYIFPDGEYVFEYTAAFNYENAKTNTITLPVVIDRQSPQLTDVELTDTTLTIKAKDNNLIDYIQLYFNQELVRYKIIPTSDGSETAVSFSVPQNLDTSKVDIHILDCAKNSTWIKLENALGNVVTNIMTSKSALLNSGRAGFNFFNSTQADITGDIILACYDSHDQLIKAASIRATLPKDDNVTALFRGLGDVSNTSYCKIFIWDSLSGLKSLDTVKIFR